MKKVITIFTATVLCGVILFSGFQIYRYYSDKRESKNAFHSLAEQIQTPEPPAISANTPPTTETPTTDPPITEWTTADQYGTLFEQNPEMVGWIAIDGTNISYPVMQSPDNPDFYLKHNFEGKYNSHGVPYADSACTLDPPSDNITVYGHHMKDGTMFAELDQYTDKAFYEAHPLISFDTRAGFGTYQIIAVFKVSAGDFAFNRFVNASSKAAFDEYVSRCKSLAFYDTGVSAQYGDKLLTLSTCEYTLKNGRLVVVAKRIS
jgi:sortase B